MNENETANERRLPRVLDKLGDLLEQGWCQGAYARGKSGRQIDEHSKSAVCFCIQGGINKIARDIGNDSRQDMRAALAYTLTRELQDGLPNLNAHVTHVYVSESELASWNDTPGRTKRDAVKLCRDTAQRLRAA